MVTFDYDFNILPDNAFGSFLEGAAGFLSVFAVFFILVFFAFEVVCYITYARGLRCIAKRRGIHHSYLAWIPIFNGWLLGSVSDQYRYVAKSQVKNRRSILFVFELAVAVVGTLLALFQFAGGFYTVLEKSGLAGVMAGIVTLLSVANLIVSVFHTVFYYIALYDLYASCEPRKRIPFLLLSIFFPVVIPFFVFGVRKSDLGMPPRKREEIPVEGEVAEADSAAPLAVEEGAEGTAEETAEETAEDVSAAEETVETDEASTTEEIAEDPKPTDE